MLNFGSGLGVLTNFRNKAEVFLEFSKILYRNDEKSLIELILKMIIAEAENFLTFFSLF